MQSFRPVLLVEDDDLDAVITRRSLSRIGVQNPLIRRTNGEDALAYLATGCNELPCAILLDLNMPRMNGLEFLGHVKAEARLKDIPVFVLTTSTSQRDRETSLDSGAAAYIVKSMDAGEFVDNLAVITRYCPELAASRETSGMS